MNALAAARPPDQGDIHALIASGLADIGWCVIVNYLDSDAVGRLRSEALARWQEGCYHLARVGRGDAATHQPGIRRDHVLWLEPPFSEMQTLYLARMEALRQAINRHLLLGLFDYECHFTRYAPGTFYRKHLDRFRNDSRRMVSSILYLNETWVAEDGGMLRLHLPTQDTDGVRDIIPRGGTLVCFLSGELWHEVLPTRRERLSLTGWFRARG